MSAEKILNKILADAESDAEEMLRRTRGEAEKKTKELLAAAAEEAGAVGQRAESEAAEIGRRRMLTASLDIRKQSLAKRRVLLDRAFDGALLRMVSLPDGEYFELVSKIAAAASETGGETVFAPDGDERRYAKGGMLEALNKALKAAGKPGELRFGGTSAHFTGGVLLSGERSDIDCSFESILAQFREEREMEVAEILFGSEV